MRAGYSTPGACQGLGGGRRVLGCASFWGVFPAPSGRRERCRRRGVLPEDGAEDRGRRYRFSAGDRNPVFEPVPAFPGSPTGGSVPRGGLHSVATGRSRAGHSVSPWLRRGRRALGHAEATGRTHYAVEVGHGKTMAWPLPGHARDTRGGGADAGGRRLSRGALLAVGVELARLLEDVLGDHEGGAGEDDEV